MSSEQDDAALNRINDARVAEANAQARARAASTAEKWDAGAGRTKTPAYGLTVQIDVTAIYLSANIGRRFFWAIRERVTSPASTEASR